MDGADTIADTIADERALGALVHQLARYQDERQYDEFLDCLATDCEYRVDVDAPELQKTMVWMAMNREELGKRLASLSAHEWQIVKSHEQTRQVTVDTIDLDGDRAQLSSTLCIFTTDEEGRTVVYAVARYEDRWQRQDNRWVLALRVVKLKTRLLDPPSPLPL